MHSTRISPDKLLKDRFLLIRLKKITKYLTRISALRFLEFLQKADLPINPYNQKIKHTAVSNSVNSQSLME